MFRIRIRIGFWSAVSVYGPRREKLPTKVEKREDVRNVFLRAEGFSCTLDVL